MYTKARQLDHSAEKQAVLKSRARPPRVDICNVIGDDPRDSMLPRAYPRSTRIPLGTSWVRKVVQFRNRTGGRGAALAVL